VLGDLRRVATGGPVGAGVAMQCRGAPWGSATVVVRRHETGSLTITGSDGRPLAIALPDAARDDWQPYLRFVDDGAGLRLLPLTGPAASCAAR
jgi:hypothetical protein